MKHNITALRRVIMMAIIFVMLSALGVYMVAKFHTIELASLTDFKTLSRTALLCAVALAVGTILAEMLRFWMAARTLNTTLSIKACWDATVANCFFAWITPGSAMAEPATIYVLTKHETPLDAAALIAFTKSVTSTIVLMGTAFVLLALGLGPTLPPLLYLPFVTGALVFLIIFFMMLHGSKYPEKTMTRLEKWTLRLQHSRLNAWSGLPRFLNALKEHTQNTLVRLGQLRQRGPIALFGLMCTHVIYYMCFVGVFIVLAHALGSTDLGKTSALAIIYQLFIYVAPTPGGAGISEGSATIFFGEVLTAKNAVVCVLMFRTLTFYAQVALGFLYLPWMGGVLHIMNRSSEPKT